MSYGDEGVVVGEGVELYIGVLEVIVCYLKTIGEYGGHALYIATFFAKSVYGDEAALAGRYEVFDNYYGLAFMDLAFDLIGEAVLFLFAAHIYEWFAQFLCYEGTLSNATGGYACDYIYIAEILVDGVNEALADEGADLGVGESYSIIAIDWRFAT